MNNQLVSIKKVSNEINRAFTQMQKAKKDYVFSVINLGEKLLEAKEYVGFGAWEDYINRNSEFRFDSRQARKYMQIAMHKDLVIALFKDGNMRPSVNQITKAISATKTPSAGDCDPENSQDDEGIDRLVMDSSPILGKEGREDIIDAEFTEIKPEPEPPDPAPIADSEHVNPPEYTAEDRAKDLIDDLTEENKELAEDNKRMRLILEDTNETAAAIKEIDKLKSLNKGLQDRINALVNENAALIKTVNRWERRYKKLQKELKEAGHE